MLQSRILILRHGLSFAQGVRDYAEKNGLVGLVLHHPKEFHPSEYKERFDAVIGALGNWTGLMTAACRRYKRRPRNLCVGPGFC